MSVELYRVDDRLIHGQVVVGWAQPLGVTFILLVDAAVAETEWEQDLYRKSVPFDIEIAFATVAQACVRLPELQADKRRGIVLAPDVKTMLSLHECSPTFTKVNLGGIHTGPGRAPCLRYVYLSSAEEAQLRALAARGVQITAQDVPACHPTPLEEILGRRRAS